MLFGTAQIALEDIPLDSIVVVQTRKSGLFYGTWRGVDVTEIVIGPLNDILRKIRAMEMTHIVPPDILQKGWSGPERRFNLDLEVFSIRVIRLWQESWGTKDEKSEGKVA